jgi:ABC-2 type transport system ATP-binding protein
MKKKLAFIGIIALDRPILILDEPFNGVDFESSEVLYEILKRLRKKGKTILLSSHIIESLTNICDEVSYLSNGIIARKYLMNDFKQMELDLREIIQQKVSSTLDDLFEKEA